MLLGLLLAGVGHATGVRWLKIGGLIWASLGAAQVAYVLLTRTPEDAAKASAKVLPFSPDVVLNSGVPRG